MDSASHTTEAEDVLATPETVWARPTLAVAHHPDWSLVGVRVVIGEGGALLGRSATACLPGGFDVPKVSRKHALVRVVGGEVVVEDLGSRNGTSVNGDDVERSTLAVGDVIRVGGILLVLTIGPANYPEPSHPTLRGYSWPLAKLLEETKRVAHGEHTVTLIGETGTGKELVARTLFEDSGCEGPLVAINCGALAEGLLEAELFGHEQGAFTGATAKRKGLVAQAAGGVLFLDEVASTPPRLQAALLRFLEDGCYRPVGGSLEQRANVRVVTATQPDILAAVQAGRFRADLWYRISRRKIALPTLGQRREDIPLLARHFARTVREDAELSPTLSLQLMLASWGGNVRQLRNVIESIAEQSEVPLLSNVAAVPMPAANSDRRDLRGASGANAETRLRVRREKKERPSRLALVTLLREVDGQIAEAARRLGVNRKTVYRWMDAHDIARMRQAPGSQSK